MTFIGRYAPLLAGLSLPVFAVAAYFEISSSEASSSSSFRVDDRRLYVGDARLVLAHEVDALDRRGLSLLEPRPKS